MLLIFLGADQLTNIVRNLVPTDGTFLLTLFAAYFTFYQWSKSRCEKNRHLLKILSIQLECVSIWLGKPGDGYDTELTDTQKFDNINPFKTVYDTGSDPFVGTTFHESIGIVPNEIVGSMYQLYYDLLRIKRIQELRTAFVMAQVERANELHNLLIKYRMNNPHDFFVSFYNYIEERSGYKPMVDKLLSWAKATHCDIIGNKNHGARKHYEDISKWVEQEKKKRNDVMFKIITFATFFFGAMSFSLNFMSMNMYLLIIIILFSYIIGKTLA